MRWQRQWTRPVKPELTSAAPFTLEILNRQRCVRFNLALVRKIVAAALPDARTAIGPGDRPLERLEQVSCIVVSDRTMRTLHRRFLGDSSSTDVITFQHGEIVTCAEVALVAAAEMGTSVEKELALYLIHGLLHLNGYDDRDAEGAARMASIQQDILLKATQPSGPPRRTS